MQDAVAEVLETREALAGGRSATVLASAAAHAALIIAAFVFASRSHDETPVQHALTIRLAGVQAPTSFPSSTASAPKPATAPPKPKVVDAPAPATPPEPPKSKPPRKTSEGATLFGRSELEAPKTPRTATPAPPSANPAPPQSDAGGNLGGTPAVGKAGVTSLEGGPFPYNAYIDRMVTLVGTHWFRPQTSSDTVAQVYFVIERNGSVRDAKIEKSSGNPTFDRAALRSIIESAPLPPLPLAYSGTFLGVHLTFH